MGSGPAYNKYIKSIVLKFSPIKCGKRQREIKRQRERESEIGILKERNKVRNKD